MFTFVLLVVLAGGVAAYAVTESESSQRATKRAKDLGADDETAADGGSDSPTRPDDEPAATPGDNASTVHQPPTPATLEASTMAATAVSTDASTPDAVTTTSTSRSASRSGERPAQQRRRRGQERRVNPNQSPDTGPVPGEIGDAPRARTAIEGTFHEVSGAPLWRRVLSLLALVLVIFGLTLAGTFVVFISVALGAEFLSNAI